MMDELDFNLASASDSQATAVLSCLEPNTALEVTASLDGPICKYARTLPTRFIAGAWQTEAAQSQLVIQEPCYWTPALPFLYELTLRWNDAAGKPHEDSRMIGLRRLIPRHASLYWEGERIVLRGTHVSSLRSEMVSGARHAEVALVIPNPSTEQCALADEHGIAVVADRRAAESSFDEILRLSVHPAVAIIVVDGHQLYACDAPRIPPGIIVAATVYPEDEPAVSAPTLPAWIAAIAVDLGSEARPPSWVAQCGKPVVAIRGGEAYVDFSGARAACDRLQAELAPEFDLAGYFV